VSAKKRSWCAGARDGKEKVMGLTKTKARSP